MLGTLWFFSLDGCGGLGEHAGRAGMIGWSGISYSFLLTVLNTVVFTHLFCFLMWKILFRLIY